MGRRRYQPCRAVGVPNHGVYDWDADIGNEFNGRGPFLRGLNEGESEVTSGTAFLTLAATATTNMRQPTGALPQARHADRGDLGRARAEGRDQYSVLGALDHREVAFHPRAFREIYKFVP